VVRNEDPLLEWLDGAEPLRVMLGIESSAASAPALQWIRQLSRLGPLHLIASRIWWPPHEYTRRRRGVPPDDSHTALESELRQEVLTALSGLPASVSRQVHLQIGLEQVAEQLIRLAVDAEADLFVLGRHPSRGLLARLWSVSHDVLGLAPMSVVCVPTQPRAPAQPGVDHAVGHAS
jgi:nucleotide-binding universal stress UspA family protein